MVGVVVGRNRPVGLCMRTLLVVLCALEVEPTPVPRLLSDTSTSTIRIGALKIKIL